MHVLLVEPDRMQAESICDALTNSNNTVIWVRNAQAAVEAADAKMPDVVVLELVLGEHNGIEFLYEFRSYSEWSHIPIILFSMQKINDLSALKKIGVHTYLYKPATTLAQLRLAVAEHAHVNAP